MLDAAGFDGTLHRGGDHHSGTTRITDPAVPQRERTACAGQQGRPRGAGDLTAVHGHLPARHVDDWLFLVTSAEHQVGEHDRVALEYQRAAATRGYLHTAAGLFGHDGDRGGDGKALRVRAGSHADDRATARPGQGLTDRPKAVGPSGLTVSTWRDTRVPPCIWPRKATSPRMPGSTIMPGTGLLSRIPVRPRPPWRR